jgi:hypothetical protein
MIYIVNNRPKCYHNDRGMEEVYPQALCAGT